MAVRTSDEMLAALREQLGDDVSDGALQLIEDMSDTLTSLSANGGGEWRQRCETAEADLDAMRKRYRDRFFGKNNDNDNGNPDSNPNPNTKPKPRTFADLFKK